MGKDGYGGCPAEGRRRLKHGNNSPRKAQSYERLKSREVREWNFLASRFLFTRWFFSASAAFSAVNQTFKKMLTKDAVLAKDYGELMRLTGADMVFLFGSVLSGNFRKDSDVDIGIYFQDKHYDKNNVYDVILDFFQTEQVDVAFLNEASPLLLHQVVKSGKPVAYKSYAGLVEFQTRCLKKYWETKKFRISKERILKDYVGRIG